MVHGQIVEFNKIKGLYIGMVCAWY